MIYFLHYCKTVINQPKAMNKIFKRKYINGKCVNKILKLSNVYLSCGLKHFYITLLVCEKYVRNK